MAKTARQNQISGLGCWLWQAEAMRYAGVDKRAWNNWVADGLQRVRLPSGRVKVHSKEVDRYVLQYEEQPSIDVDQVVDELVQDILH